MPSTDYKELETECTLMIEKLEGDLDKLQTSGPIKQQIDKAAQLVKRLNFELKLLNDYKSLQEFELYTDLSVRLFNIKTRWEVKQSQNIDENRDIPDSLDNSV